MTTRIDIREEDKEVYPVEVVYGSEGDILRIMAEKDTAISIVESDGTVIQVYNEEIDSLIKALQEIKKYTSLGCLEEAMTNPENWRAGDIVEFVQGGRLHMTDNKCYAMVEDYKMTGYGRIRVIDDCGDKDDIWASRFKWVSRP